MDTPDAPVFSRLDVQPFTPPGSPRTYDLAPLGVRERAAARAAVVAEAGLYPDQGQLYATMRDVLREVAPPDLVELLAVLDEAEAAPTDLAAVARVAPIESACMASAAYRSLLAQRTRYMDAVPTVYAQHALRGWSGPGLPEFRRERGLVPYALLDDLPPEDLRLAGLRAFSLAQPAQAAEGNSAGPSPSSVTRKASRARNSQSRAAGTSSPAKRSKRTRG